MQEVTDKFVEQNWVIVKELEKELMTAQGKVELYTKEVERLKTVEAAARSYTIWLGFRQRQIENDNAKT